MRTSPGYPRNGTSMGVSISSCYETHFTSFRVYSMSELRYNAMPPYMVAVAINAWVKETVYYAKLCTDQ